MLPKTLHFVTGNENKWQEVKRTLEGTPLVLLRSAIDLEEVQTTCAQDIARHKARLAAFTLQAPALVEDTGLLFHAFSAGSPYASAAIPGPLIKWFLCPKTADAGADADTRDAHKRTMTARLCRMLDGFGANGRGATAMCVFAVCLEAPRERSQVHCAPGPDVQLFVGSIEGCIADEPRGPLSFGWDPIFIPSGFDQTFAQLPAAVKLSISHRARALALLQEAFASQKE
jgi:inosine triphosphate pyrophosphatase